MTFRLGNRDFDLEDCRRYLQLYNQGYYAPARKSNVEADAHAYRLFEGGLARDPTALSGQLLFIGKGFGGAKVVPFERMSRAIADRILATCDYHVLLDAQPNMEASEMPLADVQRTLSPFLDLPPQLCRKRNFPVWASKVLHFSRLDVFPVLDSAAFTALGVPRSIGYPDYVRRYRPTFLKALDDLRGLEQDDSSSPTLLRRFDKILYQYGLELKGRFG